MEKFTLGRRGFLQAGAAAFLSAPLIARGAQAAGSEITFGTFGGTIDQFMREHVIPPFDKETGIRVHSAIGTAQANYARVVAAKNAPEWDLIWTNDMTHPAGRQMDLFAELDFDIIKNAAHLREGYRLADGVGVMTNTTPYVIAWNPEKLSAQGLKPTDEMLGLWDPVYKGSVVMSSLSIQYGIDFMAALAHKLGGSEADITDAVAKIRELRDSGNLVHFCATAADFDRTFVNNEASIGYYSQIRAKTLKAQGGPIECHIARKDPVNTLSTYMDMVKGAQNPLGAQMFINHVLSPEIQALFASRLNYIPLVDGVHLDDALQAELELDYFNEAEKLQFDRSVVNRDLDQWMQTWKRRIES